APGDNQGTGAVNHYIHDANFFVMTSPPPDRVLNGAAAGDRFGSALAGTTSGGSSAPSDVQLLVGAPQAANGALSAAGAVGVYRDFLQSPPPLVARIVGPAMNAHLGFAIAGGQLPGDQIADAIAIAPDVASATAGAAAGAAYVRFGE